jgi:hypothetical protein
LNVHFPQKASDGAMYLRFMAIPARIVDGDCHPAVIRQLQSLDSIQNFPVGNGLNSFIKGAETTVAARTIVDDGSSRFQSRIMPTANIVQLHVAEVFLKKPQHFPGNLRLIETQRTARVKAALACVNLLNGNSVPNHVARVRRGNRTDSGAGSAVDAAPGIDGIALPVLCDRVCRTLGGTGSAGNTLPGDHIKEFVLNAGLNRPDGGTPLLFCKAHQVIGALLAGIPAHNIPSVPGVKLHRVFVLHNAFQGKRRAVFRQSPLNQRLPDAYAPEFFGDEEAVEKFIRLPHGQEPGNPAVCLRDKNMLPLRSAIEITRSGLL